jgi:hypothetical protein
MSFFDAMLYCETLIIVFLPPFFWHFIDVSIIRRGFFLNLWQSNQILKWHWRTKFIAGDCTLIFSERQKYGVGSLKIKQKNLWAGQFWFVGVHVLVLKEVPSSHLFSGCDVIDSFFKWKLPVFFLDSDSPFNCLNDSVKFFLVYCAGSRCLPAWRRVR